ncbi:MAG: hypothetical protein JO257_01800 [Deltaproteobacteria bacterium]|nr:hypothetical protein [Deltaproteobacteria bacterium]
MKNLLLLPTVFLVACYGAAPPKPPVVPLPPTEDGAQILVHTESHTTYENVQKQATSCPQGKGEGDPSCTVTRYNVTEPVTHTTSAATYGTTPITYAQFKVMTDPQYAQKVDAVGDLGHKCQRANVPRYIGLGMLAAGLLVGPIISAEGGGGVGTAVTYGGLIGGGVSYAAGYFAFGGRDCVEARAIYNSIDYSAAMGWNTVEGADVATEMQALAGQFNQTHSGPTAASNDEAPPPAQVPPRRRLKMRR